MTCVYCRTTSNAQGTVLELHQEHPEVSEPPEDEWERRAWEYERDQARKAKAWEDFKAEVSAKEQIDFELLRDATRRHLAALGQTDALARVVFNLAVDYEQENHMSLRHDPMAFFRLAQGYMACVRELVKEPSYVLSMPFFTATDKGPLHFKRELNVEVLQALAQREPVEPAKAKKGFWGKLFG